MVVAEIPLWVIHGNTPGIDSSKKSSSVHHLQHHLDLWTKKSKKSAIYSIDVHGSKFATAGGDGTVKIWNTNALFAATDSKTGSARFDDKGNFVSSSSSSSSSEEDEGSMPNSTSEKQEEKTEFSSSSGDDAVEIHDLNDVARRKKDGTTATKRTTTTAAATIDTSPSVPNNKSPSSSAAKLSKHHTHHHRLICTLSAHTGSSVLCVRFSNTRGGKFLASAGDDGLVCIYTANQQQQQQQWSRIKVCRGHNLDVVDLAWAPDDSHLVSCSLDSTTPIIVWRLIGQIIHTDNASASSSSSSMILHPYKILGVNVHTSTVKGVAFDPAGTYIASSGDDPAICIWRAHDDWGLEKRIDAQAGIFRQWSSNHREDNGEHDVVSQSLFRRISWCTDGSFICSTNNVVKNRHVASTISREGGWSVESSSGAANLVGHKQPIVVCRHAAQLLDASKKREKKRKQDSSSSSSSSSSDNDEEHSEGEPEYATLLALGDRRGFITIWSTRQSRPIFKLQCSESRCTVTDLSWGCLENGDLMLLVSLLDGQVVALRFAVPEELGSLLDSKEKARIFQMRYGIELEDEEGGTRDQTRFFVGGNSGPKLVENALQLTLEQEQQQAERPVSEQIVSREMQSSLASVNTLVPSSIKNRQQESRLQGGKKRIRPVLMTMDDSGGKRSKLPDAPQENSHKKTDPVQQAKEAIERASAVESSAANRKEGNMSAVEPDANVSPEDQEVAIPAPGRLSPGKHIHRRMQMEGNLMVSALPYSTDRIHSADLPLPESFIFDPMQDIHERPIFLIECINTSKVPGGSKGEPIPCIDVSLCSDGRIAWKDQISGSSCSAVAVSRFLLALGTSDGCVQLYGTSPSLGWACKCAFRSHPPLIFGHPIVTLQLHESESPEEASLPTVDMIVVTADGNFGVYTVLPSPILRYKGSLMPAITHMSFSLPSSSERLLPAISRIHVTETGRLFLLLSFQVALNRSTGIERSGSRLISSVDVGTGGSMQGFVYDRRLEVWLRVSDSRFVLSDFYSALPLTKSSVQGELSRMDDTVRLGSLQSSLKASHRARTGDLYASEIFNQSEEGSGTYVASRAHCEDRMACSLALNSAPEFKHWLSLYVRTICFRGNSSQIRTLIDMLLGKVAARNSETKLGWWLSCACPLLQLDGKDLVKSIVLPEMSKNRALQRLTNEIAIEVDCL
jgi:protein HIRA/HIR1